MALDTGNTALHKAVRENNVSLVKLLLDDGADPCATNAKGQTSLYFAAMYGNPDIVMAILNCDTSNASVSIPTPENDTVLHECLRIGKRMKGCIKELVRRGADVGLHDMDHESPVHLAVMYKWSRDIIELFILQGRGMDFDRQHPFACTPLEKVVFRPRPVSPSSQGSYVPLPEWDESLAVLFLQMGVSQGRLERMLWYELNREEPGNRLLDTLMDSFAHLPSLSQLEHSVPTFNQSTIYCPNLRLGNEICREFPQKLCAQYPDERHLAIDEYIFMIYDAFAAVSTDPQSRQDGAPQPHVRQKKEDYCQRRREVPSLAHLCRSTVRRTWKANVRQVISLPIPTVFKKSILLGYQLGSQGQKDGEKKSVPSNSSSERGQPELSPSRS